MKKLSFFLMAMLFSMMSFAAEVTVKISDYATANGWKDATQYKTLKMDDNVSITVAGGSNTGKYYTNGNNWRMYQNESPKITLTATNGNLLKTVKFTYTVNNTGILVDASKAQVKSGVVYTFADEVTTYTFGVGNTGTAANGQVRFSEITVVYDVPTPSNPDAVKYTVTAKVNDPAMGTVTGAGEYEEGKTATLTANANAGYKFVNWSTGSTANPLKITVTEDMEVTANFEAIPQMTCAEAAAAASGATVVLNPFDVVYVVKGAGYTYIKDDSGVNLIFDYTMDDQFKAGDHVEGFVGVSSPYNGLPEIKPTVAFADLKVTPGTAPEATVFETVPTKEDVNKYVVFKGVKLTSNISYNTSSATNATISVGGKNVTLRNTFKLAASLTSGSTYDIYAFVAIYNGNIQMYYASSVDVSPERTITATVNPAETGTVTGAGTYKEGKTATLKATPAEGYAFTCWTEGEDTVSTAANYSFKVAADRSLVANFIKKTISYELNGGAFPEVKVPTNEELALVFKQEYAEYFAIEGLTDTDMKREVGNFIYVTNSKGGDAVKFITENANWKWLHDYILTVAGNIPEGTNVGFYWRANLDGFFHCKNAVAVGGVASADYTVAGKPEAWGAAYQAAHAVVLPTEPVDAPYTLPTPVKEGYKFVGWYDNAEGTGEPMTVIPAGWDGTLYAIWVEIYTITVEAENGTVEGAGEYEEGAEATLTATAAEGYEFTCWTSGEDTVSTANPYKFTVTADVTLVANFKEAAPTYDLELVAKDLYSASNEVMTHFEGSNSLNPDMTISVTLFASKYGTYTSTGAEEDEFNAFYAGSQILGELTYSYSDELKSDLVVIIGTITDEEETSTIKVTMYEEYLEPTDVVVLNNLQKNVQKMGWMSNLMLFNAANDTIITISGCDGTYGKYTAWGTFGADELEGKGEWKNDGENDVFVGVLYNADKTKVFQVTATTPAEKIKEYTYELADVSFTLSEVSNTLIIEAYAEEPEPVQVYLELAGWTPEQTIYAVGEMYGSIANMDNIEGADVANLTYEVESYLEGKELTITAQVEDAAGNTYLLILTGEYDSTTTALDNLNTTVAPVKAIINGQLVIINNGVQFNAQGQVIK